MMHKFIDPHTIAKTKDLPLIARTLARSLSQGTQGMHSSTLRGTGIEFSQYRVYEPGDSLARVDWKLFARSDKYFVREAERESNMQVGIIVDASQSMTFDNTEFNSKSAFPNTPQSNASNSSLPASFNKLDYSRYMAATLAHIATQQGDAIGLLALNGIDVTYLRTLNGNAHYQSVLHQLSHIQSGTRFPSPNVIQHYINNLQHNTLVLLFSDFYQQNNEISTLLSQLSSSSTDVMAIQLSSNDEQYFPYKGQYLFNDLETGEKILASSSSVKNTYLHNRALFNERWKTFFKKNNIKHAEININHPLENSVTTILNTNKQAGRR